MLNRNRKSYYFASRAGYTLVEIMLVLSIIAVLVGAGIYQLSGNLDIAKERRVEGDLQAIKTALMSYEMDNMFMPSTDQGLKSLVVRPSTEPVPSRWRQYAEKEFVDPWGHPYQFRSPGKKNPNKYDIFSFGPDGVESDDDIGNWTK